MNRTHLALVFVIIGLVLAFVFVVPAGAAPMTQVSSPSIQLRPDSASPGTRITVSGANFDRATEGSILFYFDSLRSFPIGTVGAVTDASFAATATIPPNATPGPHTLIAFDTVSQLQAEAVITVYGNTRRALYLYDRDANAAQFYQALIQQRGMLTVDIVAISDFANSNLSIYDLVIIGADTGWETSPISEQVTRLLRSRVPIFALGTGGAQLLGKMKLAIGDANGMGVSGTGILAPDLSNPIYQTPNLFTTSNIELYTSASSAVAAYLPKPEYRVVPIGTMPGELQKYSPLVGQTGRYYLWGFSDYSLLSENGKKLLVNLLWQLLLYNPKVDTLILVDYQRMVDIGYAQVDVDILRNKIVSLAALPASTSNMTAAVHQLNLVSAAGFQAARNSWTYEGITAGPGILSVQKTNAYVAAIDQYIEQLKQNVYPQLKYVIIVGAHEVIPMKARNTDDMADHKESDWALGLPQTSGYMYTLYHDPGANNLGHYLTDSVYGDLSYINNGYAGDNELVPELGVGRLVETPTQISTLIDNYISASGYLAFGARASIASFDYMDGGQAAANILGSSTDTSLILGNFNTNLIPPVMNTHQSFVYLAGHGNYNFIAPGFMAGANGTQGDTEELNLLPNSVVVTSGCHNGVNFGNMRYHDYTGNDLYGEFPERMVAHQVGIYLGATGFTWITSSNTNKNPDWIGVNEKLSVLFIKHLLQDGNLSTPGKAYKAAVNEYLGAAPDFANYTRRVLAIATLYGIPNYRPSKAVAFIGNIAKIGYSLTLKWLVNANTPQNTAVTQANQDVSLQVNTWNVGSDGFVQIPGADYASGGDTPILPVIKTNQLLPPGSQVSSISWDEAASTSTTIQNDVPLFQLAVNETQVPNTFKSITFYPASPYKSSQTSTLADGGVNLVLSIWPVQYNQATHQTRIWTKLVFHVAYSIDTLSSDMDSDADSLPDYWETSYGIDPNNEIGDQGYAGDLDGDGLANGQEFAAGTDPALEDSDHDGVSDGQEITSGTDPLNPGSHNTYLYLPSIIR